MTLWHKFKPGTERKWLYLTAGLMWSGVGIFLNKLAFGWLLNATWKTETLMILLGASLALTIYQFGFSKLSTKNIHRIQSISTEKPCIFAFQEWTSYPLVAFMIYLGIFLRVYSPIPKIYLAAIYIGIGGSLFLASLFYYKELLQPNRKEEFAIK